MITIEPEMSVYIYIYLCFCGMAWGMIWNHQTSSLKVFKVPAKFQPSSPIPAQQYLPIVFRLHQELPYHVVAEQVGITSFQVKQTLKSQPARWIQWLLMLLVFLPGTSRKPKETCEKVTLCNVNSFSSLKQAFIRTQIFSFQALSGPMHVAPLGGRIGNGFGKCVARATHLGWDHSRRLKQKHNYNLHW